MIHLKRSRLKTLIPEFHAVLTTRYFEKEFIHFWPMADPRGSPL
jgi:hypothetical protein